MASLAEGWGRATVLVKPSPDQSRLSPCFLSPEPPIANRLKRWNRSRGDRYSCPPFHTATTAAIEARFCNFGEAKVVVTHLQVVDGRWRIVNVRIPADGFDLRRALGLGPAG